MNKNVICIFFTFIFIFTISVVNFASIQYVVDEKEHTYTGKDVTINLNGKNLECDIPPIIHNERTLLPIRVLIEQLGGEVKWDGILQMVTISLDKINISMIIGKNEALVNGNKKELDVAPCLAYENSDTNTSRTIVPLRFVMENLGLEVNWDQDTFTVQLKQNEPPVNIEDSNKDNELVEDNPTDPEPPEVINPQPSEEAITDDDMIKVGVYYDNNLKSKLTLTAKTDIMIGIMKNGKFTEKAVATKNSIITLQPSSKYVKVSIDGKVVDKVKSETIRLIPEKNDNGDRIITVNSLQYRGSAQISVVSKKLMFVNVLGMQEYLYSVVPSEMPASFGLEAVKAQAVAARTYALSQIDRHADDGFNLCSTTHCQVYSGMKTENALTTQAVNETKNMIVTYKGELISTYYSASMGGYTEDVENVWGKEVPYLKAVKDPYEPKMDPGTIYFSKKEIESKLSAKNINIGEIIKIEVTEYTNSGRAYELVITGTKGKTTYLREGTRTFFNLKGQMFTIEGGNGIVGLASDIKKYADVTESKNVYIMVTTDALNVRSETSAEADKLGTVYKNDKFSIIEENEEWVKIETKDEDGNDIKGWISKEYVKQIEDITKTTIAKIAKVTASEMNVRKKASTSSDIVGTASENEGYVVIGQKGKWVNVIANGQEVWLSKDYVEILEYDLDKITNIQKQFLDDNITFRILITVYDNGHGVGMSQNGAKGMASKGFNYIEILEFYYTGVKVEEM